MTINLNAVQIVLIVNVNYLFHLDVLLSVEYLSKQRMGAAIIEKVKLCRSLIKRAGSCELPALLF